MLLLVVSLLLLSIASCFTSELRVNSGQERVEEVQGPLHFKRNIYCNAALADQTTSEVQVLLEFKSRLYHRSTAALANWSVENGHNMCLNWTGIHCDPSKKHVVSIQLPKMGLQGTITPMLGQLKHLQLLNPFNNKLQGPIPDSLGQLQMLQELDLSANGLSGSVPPSLGNCTRLEELDLSENGLSGSVPPSLGNCNRLEVLDLSFHDLSGHIPDTLGQLRMLRELSLSWSNWSNQTNVSNVMEWIPQLHQLEVLALSGNNLHGAVISKLPASLRVLVLNENNLGGRIPSTLFANCTLLEEILLRNNNLTGDIPVSIGNLKNLQRLALSNNNLTGNFPNLSQAFFKLEYLSLTNNSLGGGLPNPALFPALRGLALSYNRFSGGISTNWSSHIFIISLFSNNLRGTIPRNWSRRLEFLDLADNHLEGTIPAEICQGRGLQILELSNNNLSGPLPSALRNCWSLKEVDLGNNKLEGEVLDLKDIMVDVLHISVNRFSGDISHILTNISNQAVQLNLGHNNFTGSIPEELCRSKNLSFLSLASNNLHGKIPSCITNLAYLQNLHLSANHLSGPLPDGLQRLTGFQNHSRIYFDETSNYEGTDMIPITEGSERLIREWRNFDLSNNNLEGEILAALGQLYGIKFLNLSYNNLSGTIPAELGNIRQLQKLDLSHNRLQGPIPSTIASLELGSFCVAQNNLSGPIPTADSFNTRFDVSSFEGNPGLYGCPLTSCTPHLTRPAPPFQQQLPSEEDDEQEGLFAHFSAWSFFSAALIAFCVTFSIALFSNPLRLRALRYSEANG